MFSRTTLPILMTGAFALVGCTREPATTTKTTTETKQQGSTGESTSQTKVVTPTGESTSVTTNRFVGTVTEFKPGKTIEVLTGNDDRHAFALDGKDDVVTIDPSTVVGSKVLLIEDKPEKGIHRITVTLNPTA